MKKYNIIIPAAGSARRLRPLTDSLPKSLLKIKNKSIIEYQLKNLPLEYIKKIIIILGFNGDKIKNHIDSLDLNCPIKYYYNKNYINTNCAYSLLRAKKEMLEGFIILNCDLLFKKDNILKLLKSNYPNAINVRKNDTQITDLQDVVIDNGKIINWSLELIDANAEVMGPLKLSSDEARKVINYFDSLSKIKKAKIHCFSLFSKLVDIINYYPIYIDDKNWIEIDTIEDLEKAKLIWKK
mgnify:CR=1 FL=1